MTDNSKKTLRNIIIIFVLCLAVHTAEVMLIRTDETFFAECFINKVFGIIVLFAALGIFGMKWRDIGFKKEELPVSAAKGFGICAVSYLAAFAAEFAVLYMKGTPAHIEFFVTGFSLTGNVVKNTGIGFVVMCIFFNIINVWMEEGIFRGLCITYLSKAHKADKALLISALLFGLWHIVTPLRALVDGDMGIAGFVVMSVGYVILSMLMGIKWGLLYKMSGNVWIGMADHFFNNCVVTNLLHVVTSDGADDMQIVRVIIGELLSFAAVMVYSRIRNNEKRSTYESA